MKKLMIAAAIVCAAAFAQAANFQWGFTEAEMLGANGELMYEQDGTAFLYLGKLTSSDGVNYTIPKDAILLASTQGLDDDYCRGETLNLVSDEKLTSTAADQDYTLVLVTGLVDDLDGYNGTYVMYQGKSLEIPVPPTDPSDPTTYYATFFDDGSDYDGAWTSGKFAAASDIPEPTSGMLLLLGVAGLALRRRRA